VCRFATLHTAIQARHQGSPYWGVQWPRGPTAVQRGAGADPRGPCFWQEPAPAPSSKAQGHWITSTAANNHSQFQQAARPGSGSSSCGSPNAIFFLTGRYEHANMLHLPSARASAVLRELLRGPTHYSPRGRGQWPFKATQYPMAAVQPLVDGGGGGGGAWPMWMWSYLPAQAHPNR
jgi:hypothetical protein